MELFTRMLIMLQNGSSEMNHTTEGFLSSILNDEDLQLMDIAMNEGKGNFYPKQYYLE